MKRFLSLRLLLAGASATGSRFPVVLAAAVVLAASAIALVENGDDPVSLRLLFTSQLGIPLFFALAVLVEIHRWGRPQRILLELTALGALAAYYSMLPDSVTPASGLRHVQFNAALHLLVAVLPFAGPNRINAFWQYNKGLFLRFLTAVLYSVVLYVGLAVALAAIDKLLGIDVEGESYLRLWIVIASIFNTWFFLGGVPRDLPALEEAKGYPRGLKVFTQYVLIPLIVVYLLILTMYLGKIVVTRVWPSGWIGYLVSSVATAGILAMLLVHPVKDETENKWVPTFSRWFYVCLSPSIVMLLLAVSKRIGQYGFTENRYFLLVLAVWLAAISVYFVFSRAKNIKWIPASLCLIAFATAYGPWGAYGVARRSQTGRLERVLTETGLLVDGRIHEAAAAVPFEDRKEISAILSYLVASHGTRSIEPWFDDGLAELDTLQQASDPWGRPAEPRVRAVMSRMGINYVARWQDADGNSFHHNMDYGARVYAIDGADYYVKLTNASNSRTLPAPDDALAAAYDPDRSVFQVRDGLDVLLEIQLEPLFDRIAGHAEASTDRPGYPPAVMRITGDNDRASLSVYFNSISGKLDGGLRTITRFDADCYVTVK
ncbi:MAG: DUF4153 domain-containing protein [Candidatus Krumholzibacteriia bacterium]